MKLEQLLNNFRHAALDAYACGNDFGTGGKLGEAEQAIEDHIENAMLEALVMGKRVGCSDGVGPFCTQARQDKWDKLVKQWTE